MAQPIEVFRSLDAPPCGERELVLRSAGIPYGRHELQGFHVLIVEDAVAGAALRELAAYERENRDWPPRDVAPPVAGGRLEGVLVYALVITLGYLLQQGLLPGVHWEGQGVADGGALRQGELWRSITALTLHADVPHLLSNLIFGSFFGFLVASTHGGGLGWFAILVAAFLGNSVNGWVRGPLHASIGASTAVFAALGILAGSEWRRRHLLKTRLLRRLAPPLMGLLLFSYLGVGNGETGSRTDIGAHVFGLLIGLPVGAFLPSLLARGALRRAPQRRFAAAALAALGTAWVLALLF